MPCAGFWCLGKLAKLRCEFSGAMTYEGSWEFFIHALLHYTRMWYIFAVRTQNFAALF